MEKFEKNIDENLSGNSLEKEIESMEDADVLRRPRNFGLIKDNKSFFSPDVQEIINKLSLEDTGEVWLPIDEIKKFKEEILNFKQSDDNGDVLDAPQKNKFKKGELTPNEILNIKQIERYFKKELGNAFNFLGEIAEKMRQEGVPVEDDCRIDMEAFREIYPKNIIQKDKKFVGYERRIIRFDSDRNIAGEKLEVLKTILFNKFLGDRFIVVRSSYYDDITNGVDNVLVERETGNVVCMFDNILQSKRDIRFYGIKKIEKVRNINKKGGAMLKYGFDLDADGLISLKEIKNIPIFALVLEGRLLDKAMEKVKLSPLERGSIFEEDVFRQMVGSLRPQIEILKKDRDLLSAELINRLDNFEKNLDKLKIIS